MSIVVILIAVVCVWIYFFLSHRKKAILLSKRWEQTIIASDALFSPDKIVSNAELEQFITVHDRSSEILSLRKSPFIPKTFDKKYHLTEYLSLLAGLKYRQIENNKIHEAIIEINKKLPIITKQLRTEILSGKAYCTHSICESFFEEHKVFLDSLIGLKDKYSGYLEQEYSDEILSFACDREAARNKYNNSYTNRELERLSHFFNTILPYPLDLQQRNAIVRCEDNTLVISSAGSGKTSTIIGKAKYLIDILQIDPSKILIVTFTRKAAVELQQRLGSAGIDCCTFHSLAYRVLSEIENKKPSICESSLMLNVFNELLKNDQQFLDSIVRFILHQQSLMKLEHEYTDPTEYFTDRKKYGIQALYPDMNGKIVFTRSEEEKRLCTILTELGLDFTYEEPYEIETYTQDFKQYRPDFSIYYDDIYIDPFTGERKKHKKRIYLEHYAIDSNGEVPKWFGSNEAGGWHDANIRYNKGIVWKDGIHKKYGTILIVTKSSDFHNNRIVEILQEQLSAVGIPTNRRSQAELYDMLVTRNPKMEKSVFTLLSSFITLLKANCKSADSIVNKTANENNQRNSEVISKVIRPLFAAYQSQLKESGQIDFTDAVITATEYCDNGLWKEYDYILVDEFQDISTDRYHFLQSLRTQSPKTKLFCVGDDWQSIYRFAGSDMKLFHKFPDYFGYTEKCKIETTYRFFDPLLSISSAFIQRNPEQEKKHIISNAGESNENKSLLSFVDCGSSYPSSNLTLINVEKITKNIPSTETLIILGRYTSDARTIGFDFRNHSDNDKIILNIGGRKVPFMTVHSAKGLEADNVILINCNEGIYGFPSLVEDDPILSYLLSNGDTYENSEERRLFYVALTRAIKKMFVLYNNDKPSPFVRELTDVLKPHELLCPQCQQGHIVVQREGVAKNGNKFTIYRCSNTEAGCDYSERVFEGHIPRHVTLNKQLKELQKRDSIKKINNPHDRAQQLLDKLDDISCSQTVDRNQSKK